jgi:glycosyltransferase involved in cell wall biosynthesis
MPAISIIIPVYNGERFLSQAIDSVMAQTVVDWELIIVDDGSRDHTLEVAQAYANRDARIRVVVRPNGGPALARNRGIEDIHPTSDYIAFLDADDFCYPHALDTLMQALCSNEQAVVAYGLCQPVDAAGKPIEQDETRAWQDAWEFKRLEIVRNRLVKVQADRPTTFGALVYWNWISTPGAALIRRTALDTVGRFDPAVVPSEDWDLWIRLSLVGDLLLIPTFVLNRRVHGDSLSGNGRLMGRSEAHIRCKLAYSRELTPERRRTAKWGFIYWYLHRLSWAKSAWIDGKYWQAAHHARHAIVAFCRIQYALWTQRGTQYARLVDRYELEPESSGMALPDSDRSLLPSSRATGRSAQ